MHTFGIRSIYTGAMSCSSSTPSRDPPPIRSEPLRTGKRWKDKRCIFRMPVRARLACAWRIAFSFWERLASAKMVYWCWFLRRLRTRTVRCQQQFSVIAIRSSKQPTGNSPSIKVAGWLTNFDSQVSLTYCLSLLVIHYCYHWQLAWRAVGSEWRGNLVFH